MRFEPVRSFHVHPKLIEAFADRLRAAAPKPDELVVFTNGEATPLERWVGGRFTPSFVHHDVEAAFSGTDLTFVLRRSDLRTRSFTFSVASLRQQADLAPGGGVARYPRKRPAAR